MKKITFLCWIICVSIFSILCTSCNSKKKQSEITSRIEYSVNIQSPEADMDWWNQNLEGTQRDFISKLLMETAAKGELALEDLDYKTLSAKNLSEIYKLHDSVHFTFQDKILDTLISGEITQKNIKRLRFREQWMLSDKSFEIEKRVTAICPVAVFYDAEGIEIYSKPLYWIKINTEKKSSDMKTLTERIQYDVPIQNPNNKKDWWVENIESQLRNKFLNTLMEAAYSDKYPLYDNFKAKITAAELKSTLNFSDTLQLTSPNPPYVEYDTVIVNTFDCSDIRRIRFMEEWKINPTTFEFNKRIIGICVVLNSYDSNNEFRGIRPLFWMYFDEKYPAALGK
ncbi:MAG: hypothetical protein WCH34_16845 [Bacteroidota bacterium]